jgi:hypothetical protein
VCDYFLACITVAARLFSGVCNRSPANLVTTPATLMVDVPTPTSTPPCRWCRWSIGSVTPPHPTCMIDRPAWSALRGGPHGDHPATSRRAPPPPVTDGDRPACWKGWSPRGPPGLSRNRPIQTPRHRAKIAARIFRCRTSRHCSHDYSKVCRSMNPNT